MDGEDEDWGDLDAGHLEDWDVDSGYASPEDAAYMSPKRSSPIARPMALSPAMRRAESNKAAGEYEVLEEADLAHARDGMVEQTAEVLYITADEAGCLLRHYGWRKQQLEAEWFADQRKVRKEVGLSVVPGDSPAQVQCQTAFCDLVPVAEAHRLNCGHWFCKDCWANYLTSQVQHGRECVLATCMGMRCQLNHNHKFGCACNEIVPSTVFERFVSDAALIAKYRRWLLGSFVEGQRSIKWCPEPRCDRAVLLRLGDRRGVQCKCGHGFCFACLGADHTPAPCDLVRSWRRKEQTDDATAIWLAARTKECPKCKVRIEKNKACNHMKCVKCQHDFCWLCKKPWSKHGTETGGYYVCNIYQKESAQGLTREEQANIDSTRQLQKYTYYYKRFRESQGAIGFTEKLGARLEAEAVNAGQVPAVFVVRAVRKLLDARRVLQWTYALAYFLEGGAHKRLFEYQQQLLCGQTEGLQDVMEKSSYLELLPKRASLVNKTSSMEKLRVDMVQQVEEGKCEEALLAQADAESDMWACSHCNSANPSSASACGVCCACKLHGEADCKSPKCVVPGRPLT